MSRRRWGRRRMKSTKSKRKLKRQRQQLLPEEPETTRPPKAKRIVIKTRPVKPEDVNSAASLRAFLNIKPNDWDVLIVCDGSANDWENPLGYGSVLLHKGQLERTVICGGANVGTSNVAELMGVFWPLLYLAEQRAAVKAQGCRVHVISDSSYVVNGLNSSTPLLDRKFRANHLLWAAIHESRRMGFVLKAHHIRRDVIDLNKLCHDLANICRRSLQPVMDSLPWEVYQCNPD